MRESEKCNCWGRVDSRVLNLSSFSALTSSCTIRTLWKLLPFESHCTRTIMKLYSWLTSIKGQMKSINQRSQAKKESESECRTPSVRQIMKFLLCENFSTFFTKISHFSCPLRHFFYIIVKKRNKIFLFFFITVWLLARDEKFFFGKF
jgi:hypothetical protein